MLNSAKTVIIKDEANNNTSRSTGGGSFGNTDSSSNSNGSTLSNIWDVMVKTRNFNRIAESKGEDPFYKPPGYDIVKDIDKSLKDILGIPESTAKIYDDALQDGIDKLIQGDSFNGAVEAVKNSIQHGINSQSGASAKPVIYSDWSPASRLFGMSTETAFSEHMANTAHQREVADLKAAGLNPVLGVSGSGATAVSGSLAGAGGSSSAEKAAGVPWLDVLGATAAVVTTVATKNPMLGYMVSNIFKAFDN